MINNIKTYRPKTHRLAIGSALTWHDPALGDQTANIVKWAAVVPRVYVTTPNDLPKVNGLFHVKSPNTTLRHTIMNYMISIPGGDGVVIAAPNVDLRRDGFVQLDAFVQANRLERAWATFSRVAPDKLPDVFVIAAPILAFFMNDIPHNLTFTGDDWKKWLHEKLAKVVFKPRYFDASSYGLINQDLGPVMNAYDIELPKPPKRKPGRPKKTKDAI